MSETRNENAGNQKIFSFFRKPLVRVISLALLIVMLITAIASVIVVSVKRKQNYGIDSYIYQAGTENLLDMQLYKDGIAILQSNSVCYIDNGGNRIAQNTHKYSSPVMRTAGKYLLLFDRGANSFRIESKAAESGEYNVSSNIVNADISENGTYAYLMNADAGFQSHLLVYSRKDEKLFEWGSATDFATIVQLSSNGKRAILVSFGVENAEPYSKVISFDFSKKEPIFSTKFNNITVFAVKFISTNEIAAFTDNGVFHISKNGQYEAVFEYSPAELNCSFVSDAKLSSLSLNLYGNDRNQQTIVFDNKLKKVIEFSCDEKVNSLFSNDKYTAVVSGRSLRVIDQKNKIRYFRLNDSCMKCLVRNNTVFALSSGGISAFSVGSGELQKG